MRRTIVWTAFVGLAVNGGVVSAGVYSPEDFRSGLRAYEALYGAYRQRDPVQEGSAFQFLGYVKAVIDQQNGSAFCMRNGAFPSAVSALVREYNRRVELHDRDPKNVILEVFGHEYRCFVTTRDDRVPARTD